MEARDCRPPTVSRCATTQYKKAGPERAPGWQARALAGRSLGNWQSLSAGEQGTEGQKVLRTLRASTAAVGVEGGVASDIYLMGVIGSLADSVPVAAGR
ncbi:hypothetical protein EV644_111263 [Kribbella orskensis]|uniref:Uncharacterized protein n=1 Tax=Kribbella orskensis TaxID=2512216 RepID=A0ABY2BGV6_9ACTN|nr:hypothetical protein EV642_1112 [Kribbella sp. VKM Ac-2500]TCO19023.1 hypothetical protein EV644_111263 [Kribbella orskensis]